MPNCIIGILSLAIISFVAVVYFRKARIDSFETKLYGYMIIIDLLITIFAVLFFFAIDLPEKLYLLRDFIGKGICVLFVAWYTMFSIYLTYLILSQKEKYKNVKIERKILMTVFLPYYLVFTFFPITEKLY